MQRLTLVRGISSEIISSSNATSTRHHTSAIAAPCPSIAIMSWKNVGHCCGYSSCTTRHPRRPISCLRNPCSPGRGFTQGQPVCCWRNQPRYVNSSLLLERFHNLHAALLHADPAGLRSSPFKAVPQPTSARTRSSSTTIWMSLFLTNGGSGE